MPAQDFNDQHFDDPSKTTIMTALGTLETELNKYIRNLSPEERQKFGSINEENKLLVNKVNDYHVNQPDMDCPDQDWEEFEGDRDDRVFIEPVILRLGALKYGAETIKIMHDYDNYKAALLENKYTNYKVETNGGSNWRTKQQELQQFFPNTGNPNGNGEEQNNEDGEGENEPDEGENQPG